MITVKEIYEYIDSFAPFQTAMSFDNVGLLVGSGEKQVNRVLLALDITPQVVAEASQKRAQLIISHHPVIFLPLKTLSPDSPVYALAQSGIAAICAHTNLDMASEAGVNTCLFNSLKLQNKQGIAANGNLFEGLLGTLPKVMSSKELAKYVKSCLKATAVHYTEGKEKIHTVGICSGAGAELMTLAKQEGAQAFITGESKHSQLILAQQIGITLLAAGHFATENVVIEPLCQKLSNRFSNVIFECSKVFCNPEKCC